MPIFKDYEKMLPKKTIILNYKDRVEVVYICGEKFKEISKLRELDFIQIGMYMNQKNQNIDDIIQLDLDNHEEILSFPKKVINLKTEIKRAIFAKMLLG